MKMLKWITLGLWTLILVGSAQAGYLTPGLEKQISTLEGDDVIKVLVVLADQADIKTLNWDLHDAKATLAVRHETVLQTLQDTAKRSQGSLLSDLEANKASGDILGFTSHWIVNSVVVVGTVDSIRLLADRPDVERIEFDLHVELIEPVVSQKSVDKDSRAIGITPGVVAVGARRVWNELGIDGTGVVVGELDTGVDGSHVSLMSRWRGNYAPTSECWLDAANLGHATPMDTHGHGTHTMGTVTGLAAGDTIGVAPGALWIASNIINSGTGGGFDNGVIASFEFMADPDGNPFTMDDVPAVVQNSWGVNENFSGYYDCDSRWWDAIDNCEAAGVVVTWSAGNEGPGAESLRSPGDRAASPGNCFSVGSTVTSYPYTISSFSSRGPSGCGGEFAMKPEICAPGSDIYSASAGGGYEYMSGTSMAGPHLAGVVALMRASNPNVDVITIKQVLMDTAMDLGVAGEDNTYGHGFVDAYAAVMAVMGGIGTVEGTITDSGTGLPIEGAVVRRVGGYNTATTDANGFYSMTMPAEYVEFSVEFFGYGSETFAVTIPEDGTVNADQALTMLPSATVSGFVYDAGGAPVNGAIISVLDTPVADTMTAADGSYAVILPAAAGNFYNIRANATGMGAVVHNIEVAGDVTDNFHLPAWFGEDFESGDFTLNDWVMGGTSPWVISSTAHEGQYAAMSANIGDNQTSVMEITMDVTAASDLSFWYKVSTESNYDYLRFYVDGNMLQDWAGEINWTEYITSIAPGTHTFKWEYYKDGSVSNGDDTVYVDFIEFPVAAVPNISLDVTEFEEYLVPVGGRGIHPMNISNTGEGPLTWDISLYQTWPNQAALANEVPYAETPKGEIDTRKGVSPLAGWDGPDAFGYHWEDSNAPSGPVYNWVDIASEGVLLGHDDEAVYGPFDLGFDFNFYGTNFSSIRVSSNGWLSFTSGHLVYDNQGIPDVSQPNNMIAAFWDDLNPAAAGDIYYLADAMNNRFIVQYEGIRNWESAANETFQIILNADGTIVCQYEVVNNPNTCTVGIENGTGTDGLQVSFNSDYLQSGMAVAYFPPTPLTWVTASPLMGQTGPGGSTLVDVSFNSDGLEPGVFTAEMMITSNDPDTPTILLPVTLTIESGPTAVGDALPSVVRLEGAVPNPFNPATAIKFSLPRDASVQLNLYDVSGRLVRSLVNESMAAGSHEARWNGTDDSGHGVASGTYFARLVVDGVHSVKAMVLVR